MNIHFNIRQFIGLVALLWVGMGQVTAQVYRVGDLFTAPDGSQGIVYWLNPDGSGGWVVALDDASAGCAWGETGDIAGLDNLDFVGNNCQQLLLDTAGYAHTQAILNYQNNATSTAACVVDFAHGWYLPSSAQLSVLYGQFPFIEAALVAAGGTILTSDDYWCSAERDGDNAWSVDFSSGSFYYFSKTLSSRVRAVRSFTYAPADGVTYAWNDGNTGSSVTVLPTETATWSVTATSGSCEASDTVTVTGCATPCEDIPAPVTIGSGTSTNYGNYLPLYTYYNYSYTQQIIPASLLNNEAQSLGNIAFQYFYPSTFDRNVDIYLAHVPDNLTLADGWIVPSTDNGIVLSLVFSGAVTLNNTGTDNWFVFPFSENFAYNGTDNLLIAVLDHSGHWSNNNSKFYTHNDATTINMSRYVYRDGSTYDPFNPDVSGTLSSYVNNIRFNSLSVGNITYNSADLFWSNSENTSSWEVEYKPAAESSWISAGSTDTAYYHLTGLNPNTSYTARVRALCAESQTGNWSPELDFTTLCYPNSITVTQFDTAVCISALPLTWRGHTFTDAGVQSDTTWDIYGCTSTVTVYTLTITPPITTSYDTAVCASDLPITWKGHTFTSAGIHTDTLMTANGCDSTVTLTLNAAPSPVLTHTQDTLVNANSPITLWANGAETIVWTNADGDNLGFCGTLTVTPTETTTYYVTGKATSGDIVVNGDFEQGNTGFTSEYSYPMNGQGYYCISDELNNRWGWYADHTTGSGKYLVVDGALIANKVIWSETLQVQPQTIYNLTAWLLNLSENYTINESNKPRLQFSVNGTQVGDILTALDHTDVWLPFSGYWNSGNDTTAIITIIDQNTLGGENDFAIDDITFSPVVCETTDTITVTVNGIPPGDAQPCPGHETVTDYDGNVYNTVKIGEQCWMKENLRTTHYEDGVEILVGNDTVSNTTPYYRVNNFGYLYNWAAVMHGTNSSGSNPSGVQGVCPTGWHLPSDAEWTQLTDYVGAQSGYQCSGNSSFIAKALASTSGWYNHEAECCPGNQSTSENNSTGFSAVPGGYCNGSIFYYPGSNASFWSSTKSDGSGAWYRYMAYSYGFIGSGNYDENYGRSVRCVLGDGCLSSATEFSDTICDGSYYIWNGQYYTVSGDYTQNFTNVAGCDSVVTLHLTIFPMATSTSSVTVCENELPYLWNGFDLTDEGIYTYTLESANGCDSVETLILSVNPAPIVTSVTASATEICSGSQVTFSATSNANTDLYIWYANNVEIPGENSATLTVHLDEVNNHLYAAKAVSDVGCISDEATFAPTVTVSPGYTVEVSGNGNICEGGSTTLTATVNNVLASDVLNYQWYRVFNGTPSAIYGANTSSCAIFDLPVGSSYYYVIVFGTSGCSAISDHMPVNVASPSAASYDTVVCNFYEWNGVTYTESGTYTQTFTNAAGCDSVVTLYLTVNNGAVTDIYDTVCDGYFWNGVTYTESGDYTQYFVAANGCDSVVTLHLNVLGSYWVEYTVTACDSYTWNDSTYTQSGYYTQYFVAASGCDSLVTLHLTIMPTPSVTITGTPLICDGGNTILHANVTPAPPAGTQVDYIWYLNDVALSYVGYTDSIVASLSGVFKVQVSYDGCSSESDPFYLTVVDNTQPQLTAFETTICVGGTTTITAGVTGGIDGSVSYSWNNGFQGQTYIFTPESAGSYTFYVTASQELSGCVGVDSITINVNDIPTTPVIWIEPSSGVICNGGQINLTITNTISGANYIWHKNGSVISNATQSTLTELLFTEGDTAVEYAYTAITELPNSGCSSLESSIALATVLPNPVASVSVAGNTEICEGGTTTLVVNVNPPEQAYSYRWYKDNMLIPGENYSEYVVSEAARSTEYNFRVVVSANPGCDVSATAPPITVVDDPVVTATISDAVCCVGGTATMTATIAGGVPDANSLNNYTYTWYLDGQPVGNGSTYTTSGNESPNNYYYHVNVLATDYGCNASSNSVSIAVVNDPSVNIVVASGYPQNVCNGGTTAIKAILLGGYGNATYQWYKNGNILTGETNQILNIPALMYGTNDTYMVEVAQSGSGCANIAIVNINDLVTVAPAYTATISGNSNVCEGGTVTLNATVSNVLPDDALGYQWYMITSGYPSIINGATSSNYETSSLLTGSYDYFVVVTSNIPGCSATSTAIPVNVLSNPTVTIQGDNSVCVGESLTLNAFISGGVSGSGYTYTWNWSGYLEGQHVTTIPSFNYNANYPGSPLYFNVTISRNDNTGCNATSAVHAVSVSNTSSTSITEAACGSYTWNGQTYTQSGDYTHTFTNAAGCDSMVTLHLTIHPIPSVSISSSSFIDYGQSVSLTAYGANSYTWSTGDHAAVITVTPTTTTTYTVTGTNLYGCTATASKTVTVNPVAPDVTTNNVYNIGTNSAIGGGNVISSGGANVTARGVCWSTSQNPTLSDDHYNNSGGTGSFTSPITGLQQNTTYYVRAFATNSEGTTYGNEVSFITQIATFTITATAGPNGSITPSGTSTVNYGQSKVYTITPASNYVIEDVQVDGVSVGAPTSYTFSNVTANHTIHAMFRNPISPTVTTNAASSVTYSSAKLNATVSNPDNFQITSRGFEWKPTVGGSFSQITGNINGDNFTASLTNLNPNTSYTYRAYITYNGETVYGSYLTFTTLCNTVSSFISITTCDSYIWNGQTYTQSGDYTQTLTAANGCDSVVYMHLTILHSVTSTYSATECESYNWNGQTYTESGTYMQTLTAANGCDSTVTLHLTILPSDSVSFEATEYSSYEWNGVTYTESGDYTQTFTNSEGCDSVVTLHLTIKRYTDVILVYPNPTSDHLHILFPDATLFDDEQYVYVFLYDQAGHLVLKQRLDSQETDLILPALNNGLYLLEINVNGNTLQTFKQVIIH